MDQIALAEGLQNLNDQAEKLCSRVQEIADRLHGPVPTGAASTNPSRNGLLGNMDSLAGRLQFVSQVLASIEGGIGTTPLPKAAAPMSIGGMGGSTYTARHN